MYFMCADYADPGGNWKSILFDMPRAPSGILFLHKAVKSPLGAIVCECRSSQLAGRSEKIPLESSDVSSTDLRLRRGNVRPINQQGGGEPLALASAYLRGRCFNWHSVSVLPGQLHMHQE
jgi:hypothetical protein